ncbi:MAG: hypothetical protein GTO55_08725 [Armatimonadetes bacterium]|nr:hypothetical protein [Armatimonadota bacterium]NIM24330.1 hypothetical protein [Armatimonadota bacterium]NIM68199.1 hypothetical protein [Armatimonadota bacterium]NIM75100.1 hypothetical protein [Armatimonadota bacterium]NIN06404.1 hypothetical protein [Armatimonadota bacterium]
MKSNTAPRRKQVSRGLGILIILIAAVVIVVVAYMATRPGGFKGTGPTMTERMQRRGGVPGPGGGGKQGGGPAKQQQEKQNGDTEQESQ